MDTVTKQMVDDYWTHRNGVFINNTNDITIKYGIPWTLILKKIKKVAGYNKKFNDCEDCNAPISIMTYTRMEYRRFIQKNTRCKNCSDIYIKNSEAPNLEKRKFLQDLQPLLNLGIKEKNWIGLDPFENDFLIEIINRRERFSIFDYVFDKKFDYASSWNALNKLNELNLVIMERDRASGILGFHFDNRLQSLMEADRQKTNMSQIIKDTFSFNLNKCHKDILNTKADYSGSFILEHDIILKRNTFFKYEAFIQSDGSINFICAPTDQFLNRTMKDGFGKTFYSGKSKLMKDLDLDLESSF